MNQSHNGQATLEMLVAFAELLLILQLLAMLAHFGYEQALGFSDQEVGRASLLVTEAATNLAKHARGGEILLRPLERGGGTGIELLAVDRGPGAEVFRRAASIGFRVARPSPSPR